MYLSGWMAVWSESWDEPRPFEKLILVDRKGSAYRNGVPVVVSSNLTAPTRQKPAPFQYLSGFLLSRSFFLRAGLALESEMPLVCA